MSVHVEEAKRADLYDVLKLTKIKVDNAKRTMDHFYLMSTMSWTGFIDEEPVCVWGLMPPTLLSDQAYLWLLTTEGVKEHRFLFVRHSQRWMQEMLKRYPTIVGHCRIGADESIRWLKWLGAKFSEPDDDRLPFVIRAK